jgi:hypothetical protein
MEALYTSLSLLLIAKRKVAKRAKDKGGQKMVKMRWLVILAILIFGMAAPALSLDLADEEPEEVAKDISELKEDIEEEVSEDISLPTHIPISGSLEIPLEPGAHKMEFSAYPGESVSKKMILTNSRDITAYNISHTPVTGNATDMVNIRPELIEEISAGEEGKFVVTVSVPEDQELGNYTAYAYLLYPSEGFPPSMPIKIDFIITVAPKVVELYGIDLRIDGDDNVTTKNVTSNETASFEIAVKNTGIGLDVMQIEEPEFEDGEGWDVKLYAIDGEVSVFPCDMILNAGEEDYLLLNVTGTTPGTNLSVEITGRSCANVTKVDSVRATTFITKKMEEAVNDTDATEIAP